MAKKWQKMTVLMTFDRPQNTFWGSEILSPGQWGCQFWTPNPILGSQNTFLDPLRGFLVPIEIPAPFLPHYDCFLTPKSIKKHVKHVFRLSKWKTSTSILAWIKHRKICEIQIFMSKMSKSHHFWHFDIKIYWWFNLCTIFGNVKNVKNDKKWQKIIKNRKNRNVKNDIFDIFVQNQ